MSESLKNVKAMTFDVFGTVVDWRSSIAREAKMMGEQKGFDFDYHTSMYTTKAGATYLFCYEYGYLPIEGDMMVLVKKKEYEN